MSVVLNLTYTAEKKGFSLESNHLKMLISKKNKMSGSNQNQTHGRIDSIDKQGTKLMLQQFVSNIKDSSRHR